MNNQRRLGRGLEALLGRSLDEHAPGLTPSTTDTNAAAEDGDGLMSRDAEGQRWLDLGVIEPNPFQPRQRFDEEQIADLADSIRAHGILQPLLVRRVEDRFQLVAGERRLRAAQAAGWERVPVQVKDLTDQQTAELALVENLQRTDLNPIEKATSFQRYLTEYDCTQEELAQRVNVNRSTVANLIRLLELDENVKQMVVAGELSQGHARALLPLSQDRQREMARRVASEGLSVRKIEQLAQDAAVEASEGLRIVGNDGVSRKPPRSERSAQVASLEQELQKILGTKVELRQTAKGNGRMTIHFRDADEFERLRDLLSPSPGLGATGAG
ncbi:ParB/RepB/Spo0J family partition protein [Botrimarina hoheduenensis]|uniref:Putative chromosome-partitioning protein ParB n=1 Tax=Botrimarina hoheduenensis TaxID=2528000 RepID=A0A5C5WC72_9BACT|nr:ParB/RepB/Spo0J family partition protein [Botrimarina hoheduenensis]TWT47689.1 putative chromosome-partitioning protein ParB [Botrimarina hoheduenensis]